MSCYSFWILRRIYLAPLYHLLIEEVHQPLRAVPQATILLHQKKNDAIKYQLKTVLGYHFEIAGEAKMSIRVQRRAPHW